MKAFLCQANPQSLCSLLAPFGPSQSSYSCPLVQSHGFKPSKMKMSQGWRIVQRRKGDDGAAVGCASWSLEAELQRELEAEMKEQEEGEGEEIGMARFRHKCEEGQGLVELLECLEREAIMGEDVGKEPLDYNRRAHIFDTTSRVIQALRQNDTSVSPQHSSE
ncbi:uncharacterized protein LOC114735366 [Neltuma alba]|uniref:uncharacterized protein LOC114735366 n=1 Tax=Neltuma alba TaxID=207710 RepID=UPI0010A57988|nr:uncharacterized protein LOC114735366 [Prosopis alba]